MDLFAVSNKDTRLLTIEFMSKLTENGIAIKDLIKFMNSLEYGLVTVSGAKMIDKIWGTEFYETLGEFLEIKNEDLEKYFSLIGKMHYLLVESNVKRK